MTDNIIKPAGDQTPEQRIRSLLFNVISGIVPFDKPAGPSEHHQLTDAIIAFVLPAHEAHVRTKIADQIEDLDREGFNSSYDRGLNTAEATARGNP